MAAFRFGKVNNESEKSDVQVQSRSELWRGSTAAGEEWDDALFSDTRNGRSSGTGGDFDLPEIDDMYREKAFSYRDYGDNELLDDPSQVDYGAEELSDINYQSRLTYDYANYMAVLEERMKAEAENIELTKRRNASAAAVADAISRSESMAREEKEKLEAATARARELALAEERARARALEREERAKAGLPEQESRAEYAYPEPVSIDEEFELDTAEEYVPRATAEDYDFDISFDDGPEPERTGSSRKEGRRSSRRRREPEEAEESFFTDAEQQEESYRDERKRPAEKEQKQRKKGRIAAMAEAAMAAAAELKNKTKRTSERYEPEKEYTYTEPEQYEPEEEYSYAEPERYEPEEEYSCADPEQYEPEEYANTEPEEKGRPFGKYDDDSATFKPEYNIKQPEIDSRFNLGGSSTKNTMYFGGKAVDMSADADYTPVKQTEESLSHWTEKGEEPEEPEENVGRRKSKRKEKQRIREEMLRRQKNNENAETDMGLEDEDAYPADYAEYKQDEVPLSKYEGDASYFPPTFREYVASIIASVFLRVKGGSINVTNSTMSDTEEDLGAEVSPAAAMKYYGSFIRSQKLRLRIAAGLLAVLVYISSGLPVPGMLNYLPVTAAACCALQLAIMLMCLDVVTVGITNIFRLKFGAETLMVISGIATVIDGFVVAVSDSAALHIPLCALSGLTTVGMMFATYLNTCALRRATRVPAIGKHFYAVTGEMKKKEKQITLLKSLRSAKGFVRRAEEAPPDETFFLKAGPFILLVTLLLAVIVTAVHNDISDFVYIFSAILAPAVPVTALAAYALPYCLGTRRMFRSGAAIAGWSGLCDIGISKRMIVTDRDLFPEESVTMESVRVFADESPDKVIAYAGTMICASGACTAGCFGKLMKENNCQMKQVESFEYLSGGGMRGIIDGHTVLCGSTDLMRLMNVRIPFRLTEKTSVLLAIDGILYGIFSLKYTPQPQIRKALVELMRSGRHPVFAVRDFNINPEMLHNVYDLATDGYDFPPYVERFEMSEASNMKCSKIAAVICSEGLAPLTTVADVGRSMYLAARINLGITVAASVAGCLAVFVKLMTAGFVTAGFLMAFMALWAVPVFLAALYVLK